SYIFQKLHDYQLKVNLIQNSALSFSVCIDNKFHKFDDFYNELKAQFKIDVYKGIDLYTVRHFDDRAIAIIEAKGNALLKQINKETSQIVVNPN
ncbi:MAG: aspartate kinase, partial [Polaribacter sp.]